jgi:hypothetical protein
LLDFSADTIGAILSAFGSLRVTLKNNEIQISKLIHFALVPMSEQYYLTASLPATADVPTVDMGGLPAGEEEAQLSKELEHLEQQARLVQQQLRKKAEDRITLLRKRIPFIYIAIIRTPSSKGGYASYRKSEFAFCSSFEKAKTLVKANGHLHNGQFVRMEVKESSEVSQEILLSKLDVPYYGPGGYCSD